MPILAEKRQQIIADFKRHGSDVGSTEVQVALLTEKIQNLSGHLKSNKKDTTSGRGLLVAVGKRKRLLASLKRNDESRYRALIGKLGLRK